MELHTMWELINTACKQQIPKKKENNKEIKK
jgi:hypothetical protein